ncbi:MAG: ribosome small subunit-dependent GTPase A [Thermomicrobiales bacterium]|nr:ribosome small subunit-dependent GTPase A [Thermomicrobiales bacterium]
MLSPEDLGFHAFFAAQFATLDRPHLTPARIVADGQGVWHLAGCRAPLGELSGRLRGAMAGVDRPVAGDWVAVADGDERAIIHHGLRRRTALVRRAADAGAAQVIAANVDRFFVVTSANRDLNIRRIERYLTAVWESGAAPVIVLNKVDLVEDAAPLIAEIASVALGVPIVPVSAITGTGLNALQEQIGPGATIGLIGSSGVGKSSLANRLLGRAAQQVNAIRDDDARGRHTTTRRELLMLPNGGMLVDTPGMREFGLLEDGGGVDAAFADIAGFAEECRFADCRHESEPGCAVRAAIAAGVIGPERWASYRKLQKEIAAYATRRDPVLAANERKRWKAIHKSVRAQSRITGKP